MLRWASVPSCMLSWYLPRLNHLKWTTSCCVLHLWKDNCGNNPELILQEDPAWKWRTVCYYWYNWWRIQVFLYQDFRRRKGRSSAQLRQSDFSTSSPTTDRPRAWLFRNFWGSQILLSCHSVLEVSQSNFPYGGCYKINIDCSELFNITELDCTWSCSLETCVI